jgi:hypothetical protein
VAKTADPADLFPQRSGAPMPTRYEREADSAQAAKNYYDELFGPAPGVKTPAVPARPASTSTIRPATQTAAPKTTPARSASAPPSAPFANPQTRAGLVETRRPTSAPPAKRIPVDGAGKVLPVSSEAPEKDEKPVIQAGFEKQAGVSERGFIQQVRSDSTQPANGAPATEAAVSDVCVPTLTVEWVKRSDMNVGQECQIHLVVKNTGRIPATQIALDATFPNTVRLTSADPKPAASAEKVTWNFDVLAPSAEKRVMLKLIPSRRGDLGATAAVRFTTQAATSFKVDEPQLKLAVKGPGEVMLGDPASQTIIITNPGTGIARDVKVEAKLSDGLEHREGTRLEIPIGALAAGETQQVRLGLMAIKGGLQSVQLAVTSSSEASSSANAAINVIAPNLEVAMSGPGLRYKGRNAKYTLKVTNDGAVPNANVRVTQSVPDGFQFVSADRGGKYEPAHKAIHWFLGRIDPGQTQLVSCELTPNALGDFKHQAIVQSDNGLEARAHVATRVEGTASLDTAIVDLDDPVEVGGEAAWEVRVTNTGSKAANSVAVACELPAEVVLMSAVGPTDSVADKKVIHFKPLPQLAPGQQAIYRVHVRGIAEGVHRLRATITSDALDQPVSIEEATKFYADDRK